MRPLEGLWMLVDVVKNTFSGFIQIISYYIQILCVKIYRFYGGSIV